MAIRLQNKHKRGGIFMGASFDLAVTKWTQKPVEFIEFHEIDTFSFDQVSHGEYRSIQDNEILYQGCYIDLPLKNERSNFYLSYYLEQAQQIKSEILKHEKWQLCKWLKALIKEHGEEELYFSDAIDFSGRNCCHCGCHYWGQ